MGDPIAEKDESRQSRDSGDATSETPRKSVLHNMSSPPTSTPTVITLNPSSRKIPVPSMPSAPSVPSVPQMVDLSPLAEPSEADASNWPLLSQTNPPTPDHLQPMTYRSRSPQVMPYNRHFVRAPGVPMPPIPPNLMLHNQLRPPFELRQPERRRGRPPSSVRRHPYSPQMSQQQQHSTYPMMKGPPPEYLNQMQSRAPHPSHPPHPTIAHHSQHYQYGVANGPRLMSRPSLQCCNPSVFTQQQRGQSPVSSHHFINMVNGIQRRVTVDPRPPNDIRDKIQTMPMPIHKEPAYQWYDAVGYREVPTLNAVPVYRTTRCPQPPILTDMSHLPNKERTVESILDGRRYPTSSPYMMSSIADRNMMGHINDGSSLPQMANGMPRFARPPEHSIEILRSALAHGGEHLPLRPLSRSAPYSADVYDAFCRSRNEGKKFLVLNFLAVFIDNRSSPSQFITFGNQKSFHCA